MKTIQLAFVLFVTVASMMMLLVSSNQPQDLFSERKKSLNEVIGERRKMIGKSKWCCNKYRDKTAPMHAWQKCPKTHPIPSPC